MPELPLFQVGTSQRRAKKILSVQELRDTVPFRSAAAQSEIARRNAGVPLNPKPCDHLRILYVRPKP